MAIGFAVISALVPGFLWLWVFTHGRSYRGAPLRVLLTTFLLGAISTFGVAVIYSFVLDIDVQELATEDFARVATAMYFIVGPVEETSKFLAVRLGVYRTRHLREPLDGLIYGAAASLGFATAENIGYALAFGPEIMIVRGPVSTVAHVIFGSIWALSLNPRAHPARRKVIGLLALGGAAALHGTFNVLAFTIWGIFPAIGLIFVGLVVVIRTFRRVKRNSTYHLRRNVPHPLCFVCSAPYSSSENFCTRCGAPTTHMRPRGQECSNCHARSKAGVKFCSNCGDLFVYRE